MKEEHLARLAYLEDRVKKLEVVVGQSSHRRSSKGGVEEGDAISLCVGGKTFSTTTSTLRLAGEGSFLQLVAEAHENPEATHIPFRKNSRGAIYIDRSPKHFLKVLDFLRNGEAFVPPRMPQECDELLQEARFYGLQALAVTVDRLRVPRFTEARAVRTNETGFTLTSSGDFWAAVTVPDPLLFSVTLQLEDERSNRPKRRRCGETVDNPWSQVVGWTMAIRPRGEEGRLPPSWKRVWLPNAEFDWKPARRETDCWYLKEGGGNPWYASQRCFDSCLQEQLDQVWKLVLLDGRPANALDMPPLASQPLALEDGEATPFHRPEDLMRTVRRSPQDLLEMWPEPAFATALVPDLGSSTLQISFTSVKYVNAGARVTFTDGSSRVFWTCAHRPHAPHQGYYHSCEAGDKMLPRFNHSILSSLGLRLDSTGTARASRDGVDFLELPGGPGHEILFHLDWRASSSKASVTFK